MRLEGWVFGILISLGHSTFTKCKTLQDAKERPALQAMTTSSVSGNASSSGGQVVLAGHHPAKPSPRADSIRWSERINDVQFGKNKVYSAVLNIGFRLFPDFLRSAACVGQQSLFQGSLSVDATKIVTSKRIIYSIWSLVTCYYVLKSDSLSTRRDPSVCAFEIP